METSLLKRKDPILKDECPNVYRFALGFVVEVVVEPDGRPSIFFISDNSQHSDAISQAL